jgi:DNA-binding response OmpR family regulator
MEKNILIVEDEIISTEYLKDILNELGYNNIYEATDATKAVEITNNHNIDIAFMDININGAIDGIECAKMINKNQPIAIIFTSAYGDSETIKEASKTNTYGFVIKPFDIKDIETTLTITLSRIENIQKTETKKDKDIVHLNDNQKYNLSTNTLTIDETIINLTKKESDILYELSNNLNQNISYEILKSTVWNNKDISYSTIRDTVSRLKKKAPKLNINTIIDYGYILKDK